jgi:hypothetical protein
MLINQDKKKPSCIFRAHTSCWRLLGCLHQTTHSFLSTQPWIGMFYSFHFFSLALLAFRLSFYLLHASTTHQTGQRTLPKYRHGNSVLKRHSLYLHGYAGYTRLTTYKPLTIYRSRPWPSASCLCAPTWNSLRVR